MTPEGTAFEVRTAIRFEFAVGRLRGYVGKIVTPGPQRGLFVPIITEDPIDLAKWREGGAHASPGEALAELKCMVAGVPGTWVEEASDAEAKAVPGRDVPADGGSQGAQGEGDAARQPEPAEPVAVAPPAQAHAPRTGRRARARQADHEGAAAPQAPGAKVKP